MRSRPDDGWSMATIRAHTRPARRRAPPAERAREPFRQGLGIAAGVLVLAGVAAALVSASIVSAERGRDARLAFANTFTDVTLAHLKLAILHEQDLVVNAAAFMAANPHTTQAQFLAWSRSVRALARYPELAGPRLRRRRARSRASGLHGPRPDAASRPDRRRSR